MSSFCRLSRPAAIARTALTISGSVARPHSQNESVLSVVRKSIVMASAGISSEAKPGLDSDSHLGRVIIRARNIAHRPRSVD